MTKSAKFKSFILPLFLIVISCSDQSDLDSSQMKEVELRTALGFDAELPSEETRQRVQSTTEPRNFESVEDARNFINSVSKEFKISFTKEQIQSQIKKNGLTNKGGDVTVVFDDGAMLTIPCDSNVLDPVGGCDDGSGGGQGCGSGNVVIQSSNQSISFYFNATFNYDSDGSTVTASNFDSYTTGFTMGTSYNHVTSSHSVSPNGTINFTIRGTLNYNVFVDGVGTVWTDPVTMIGSYNPCSGNSGILELFLEPAGGGN